MRAPQQPIQIDSAGRHPGGVHSAPVNTPVFDYVFEHDVGVLVVVHAGSGVAIPEVFLHGLPATSEGFATLVTCVFARIILPANGAILSIFTIQTGPAPAGGPPLVVLRVICPSSWKNGNEVVCPSMLHHRIFVCLARRAIIISMEIKHKRKRLVSGIGRWNKVSVTALLPEQERIVDRQMPSRCQTTYLQRLWHCNIAAGRRIWIRSR
mmetsp:Transcript_63592/g.207445  ORF Transcript_63592/g.207445 Transcript_63592/m.207445 type:complete len:209 (+) Transcript_63592:990-1616(+)